ncbi:MULTISPECIES: GNAT family N-acetyltransferase [Micromonospora]|uniref:GNAT family N-acetyltransferase n=1 Tax=Micromonospora sicca TaxID=2202420 RepID=A0A317DKT5_9ACTN|nr:MULTISPECIES: GNAT family N-acetyltransferase [unclassified Micromonospora]MBM0229051.1 GNAT family N-acetyltransferase [Micromonospora sp. ATA51]PWR14366.1 GNAT family N-acetyltransferase [Micromonospora sp. 4G51]
MIFVPRPFRPADAPAVAALLRAANPHVLVSPELIAWQATANPPAERYALLVSESTGEVVGVARTGLLHESAEPGLGFADVTVHPGRRGGGVGSALLAAAEERLVGLGARTAYAKVADDPSSLGFAERRGYRRGRRALFLRLELATAALPDLPVPPGVILASAADLADPRPLYEADLDAARDEPGDVGMDAISYPDWLAAYWDRPDLDRALTRLAMVDDAVAAFSLALTDGRRGYQSGMTGTRPAHRRSGLAGLVKVAALRGARRTGFRYALTTNDAGNDAMLALNHRLGYRTVGGEWRYLRNLCG